MPPPSNMEGVDLSYQDKSIVHGKTVDILHPATETEPVGGMPPWELGATIEPKSARVELQPQESHIEVGQPERETYRDDDA